MAKASRSAIKELVMRRQQSDLESQATEYIESGDWKTFLSHIGAIHQTSAGGKARDSAVILLQLEPINGTDSDIFTEFSSLEGRTLPQIRASARNHAIGLLKDQIENRHTYFIDVDEMARSPFAILVKDVIEARKRELASLEGTVSRIEVLGTFYGFTILMIEGSKPAETQSSGYGYRYWRRRTWLDEHITDEAVDAVKQLTSEMADPVDIDKRYRTLGSSRIFKDRCTKDTASILADAVRLTLYKVPGNRARAARDLGRTRDSRSLPFLHHRLTVEKNRKVRMSIIEALGMIGHESSIDILNERAKEQGRYMNKEGQAAVVAIGGIYSPQCRGTLIALLREGKSNTVKAAAISALSKQDATGLVEIIAPYLVNRSRPIVRASVLAMMELGSAGKRALRERASIIIGRIGSDKPSIPAMKAMMTIPEVASMKSLHQYFAKRICQYNTQLRRWQQYSSNRGYSYYWTRRERRTKQELENYIRLAGSNLKPPFDSELIDSIRFQNLENLSWLIAGTELGKAVSKGRG